MSIIEFNRTFIIAAYSVAWVVIVGYLVHLVRKGARARADYDRIARGDAAAPRL